MDLRIGTGAHVDTREAAARAAREALASCRSPTFALVFATPDHTPDAVATAVNQELGKLPWAGAVSQAIFHGRRVLERGIAIGVLESEAARVRVGVGGPLSAGARAAGCQAALQALADLPLPPADRSRAMILLTDIGAVDAAEVLRGAVSVAGAGIAWGGGGAGLGRGDPRPTLFAHGRALRDQAVAIALDCGARVGAGVQHGWQPRGAPALVTRVRGAVVEQLEYEPAATMYRANAGAEVDDASFEAYLTNHPLGIPQADGEFLIRDPRAVDAAGALHFVAAIPEGALVRIMDGTPATLVAAASVAASMARNDAGGPLGGALVFDCISRFERLGSAFGDELDACARALGDDVPLLGCLTAGEVGAFGARMPQFHNKTMVVLGLPARP